jgi:hypothetical protein
MMRIIYTYIWIHAEVEKLSCRIKTRWRLLQPFANLITDTNALVGTKQDIKV